ncbi:MAG TPA: hypothetical protein VHS28_04815 [Chloroflexota bacterium]|nr:hypothetical protein [Chloroflexota bacterium]
MEDSSVMRFLDELEQRIAEERIERTIEAAWREAECELDQVLQKIDRFQSGWEKN